MTHREKQELIAKQIEANGKAMADLTLRQMAHEAMSEQSDLGSMLSEEEPNFHNVFTEGHIGHKVSSSKQPKPSADSPKKKVLPHHTLPKMHFLMFDSDNPKVWIDKCLNYFSIYTIPATLQVTTTTMHLEGNATKWWQAYKQGHPIPSWTAFCAIVQEKFRADDFCTAITDLLALRQTGTVEEYTKAFQAIQFDITMHNCHYDDMFFASTYAADQKEEIRVSMEPHVPSTVDKAAVIARIQQRAIERAKTKGFRN